MKKKKVLYLITKSNWGGAQRYVYDLATQLDPVQFDVTVALGGDGILSEQLAHAGIRTIRLTEMQNEFSLTQLLRAVRELTALFKKEQPDVIHNNSSFAGLAGALAGRLTLRKKIIFTAHGWAFNEDRPLKERLIFKATHWLTVLLSHKTIAVSRAIVKELNWPFVRRRFVIINPGRTIGAMYERAEARQMLASFHPPLKDVLEKPWLMTIAELHPIKRHTFLFSAFKECLRTHPDTVLVCIGDGVLKNDLEAYIQTQNLTNQIFLTGAITEAARFLKAADIFVLPSKSEAYGYVVHEAGAAGVPVIATRVGGILDIIERESLGTLVTPDDVSDLTRALKHTLEDTETTKEKAVALETHLKDRTVARMAIATIALYQTTRYI